MTKEFLWAGKSCDLNYPAASNIGLTTGLKGSFCAWVRTQWGGAAPGGVIPGTARLLCARYNDQNWLLVYGTRTVGNVIRVQWLGANVVRNVDYVVDDTSWPRDTWKHVAVTWDMTGGAGVGVVRLYVDGVEQGTATTTATPLTNAPTTIAVGNKPSDSANFGWKGEIDDLAIWNDVMTAPQALALFNAGRKHLLVQADGTGTLTFFCNYNGTYNATLSVGSGVATITTATQCARFEDGSQERSIRQRLHLGTKVTSPVTEDVDRVTGTALLWKGNTQDASGVAQTDYPGYAEIVTAATGNPYFILRDWIDYKRTPMIWKIRLWWSGLAANEYFQLGPYNTYLRFYNDKITDDADASTHKVYVKSAYSWSDSIEWIDLWYVVQTNGTGTQRFFVVNGEAIMATDSGWNAGSLGMRFYMTTTSMPTSTVTIRVESVEVFGPTQYQVNDSPCDNFMLSEYNSLPSGKVWQRSGIERAWNSPVKYASNPVLKPSDFPTFGDFLMYGYLEDRTTSLRFWLNCMSDTWGADAGVYQLRFFDSADGRTWTQDAANPVFNNRLLSTHEGEWDWSPSHTPFLMPMLQDSDGANVVPYCAQHGYDGYEVGLLRGMTDEYSLAASQKYARNPVISTYGGAADSLYSRGNRDMEPYGIYENPWWVSGDDDRYFAFGRMKVQSWTMPFVNELRYGFGLKSPDLIHWQPLTDTTALIPCLAYWHWGYWRQTARDQFQALIESFDAVNGLHLHSSEDGILWEERYTGILNLEPLTYAWENADPSGGPGIGEFIRFGDEWLIFYRAIRAGTSSDYGLATIRYDGFTDYELSAGQTSGWLESCAFTKPTAGWGPFLLNVNCQDGAITVAVIDADTRAEIVGYGAADMDAWTGDHVDQEVTWGGESFTALMGSSYAFKITATRPAAGDASPKLYAYTVDDAPATVYPTATALKVNALSEPIDIDPAAPIFSWTFADTGETQTHVKFVLTDTVDEIAKYIAGETITPLYDTGWIAHTTGSFTYGAIGFAGGPALADLETYGWTVLVKSSSGEEQQLATAIAASFTTGETVDTSGMTLLEAQTEIVKGILHYSDWRGGNAPYLVNIRTRREGNPRVWFGEDGGDVTYPLFCVKLTSLAMGAPQGQQQPITFQATIYYVVRIDDNTYPEEEARKNLGRIIENLNQSNNLNRAWITDFVYQGSQFQDSDFERFLRANSMQYTSGEATYRVTCWYNR